MEIKETIGIDISKKTIDVHIYKENLHKVFDNNPKGLKEMVKWGLGNSGFSEKETIFVFEHTGHYSLQLSSVLSKRKMMYVEVSGLEIKRSLGLSRGKNDKVDAAKIARYAYRLKEELEPTRTLPENLQSLKRLLSLRDRLVKQRAGFKASLKEEKRVLKRKDNKTLLDTQQQMIGLLSNKIEQLEEEMDRIVKESAELEKTRRLITSIKGVGPQTALYMIVYTAGFTKFEKWRKFASYCGIAPFPNSSGTSIRGRAKVNHLANKKIKSLLDLCAKTALQYNPEIKQYYDRRTENGKNRMSTINVIRNKLLSRIFAVVKRGTPYVDTMKYAA